LTAALCSLAGCGDDDATCPGLPEQPLAEIVCTDTRTIGQSFSALRVICYYPAGPDTLYDLTLDAGDKLQKFVIDQSSNPDFDAAASILTNGIDDNFYLYLKLPSGVVASGGNTTEFLTFRGGYSGNHYPDLEGAEVTRVFLYVDNIWFDNSPPNTTYHILYRAVIMGRP